VLDEEGDVLGLIGREGGGREVVLVPLPEALPARLRRNAAAGR
jgi:hypothetical protein